MLLGCCEWEEDAEQTQQAIGNDVVDWLIVDHYTLDRRWHQTLRPSTKHLMDIDDLAIVLWIVMCCWIRTMAARLHAMLG